MTELAARGIRLSFLARLGLIERFEVSEDGQSIAPLHRAPWVGTDEVMPPDAAPHLERLGGDFFCAPFAGRDQGSPLHGWPANSNWTVREADRARLRATLDRRVRGARLTKTLHLRDDHPFVYQCHTFEGGAGRVEVANHANVSLATGGLISASPKRRWETPADPLESDPDRGRSRLRYPAQARDPTRFPGADNGDGPVDLTRFPWGPRHEDFVIGLEAPGHALGWTAVTRPAEGDVYLSLRNPRALPMTMLWQSNGGRDYPPFSGRHFGCLGVEEGSAAGMLGASDPADLIGPGALTLGGEVSVRHVIGALRWPSGERVADVRLEGETLVLGGASGGRRVVPFDAGFLDLEAP